MNANTLHFIGGGTGRNQIPAQVVAGTTETVFQMATDTSATTVPAVLQFTSPTAIKGAQPPFDPGANPALTQSTGRQYGPAFGVPRPYSVQSQFDGVPFRVRLAGTFTSGVAANDLQIALYLGSSATLASDHVITAALTTGTSANFGAVSGSFFLEVRLIWDSTTTKLAGQIETAVINPTGVASTIITPAVVTATTAATFSVLQFVGSAKWNAANAGNTVQVTEFSIEG